MLWSALHSAGLENKFQFVLSVDAVKVYKPHPGAYQLAATALDMKPNGIAFVSANGWDVAGAKAFGFQTCWLNRSDAPVEMLGISPDRIIKTALELKNR